MKYLWFLFFVMLSACGRTDTQMKLAHIDTLLHQDSLETAIEAFNGVRIDEIKNKEDSALYYLLKTQIFYRQYQTIKSDSLINYSIDYYERTQNKQKLAESYYYKGETLYEMGEKRQAMVLLKKAEYLSTSLNDIVLSHKIYEHIASYNLTEQKYEQAFIYAKRALDYSIKLGRKEWIAFGYMNYAVCFGMTGKEDSCRYYLLKCEPYIPFVKKETHKSNMWANLGESFRNVNPQKAKEYLYRSISIYPRGTAYATLAGIVLKEGDLDKAEKLWRKAFELEQNPVFRIQYLRRIYDLAQDRRQYAKATELSNQIIKLKDSLDVKQKEEQIEKVQADFDHEKENEEKDSRLQRAIYGIILLFLMIIVSLILVHRMYCRERIKAKEHYKDIEHLQEESRRMWYNLKRKMDYQENKQQERLEQIRISQELLLVRGRELYDGVRSGKNIVQWKKEDFDAFFKYYKLVNLSFEENLSKQYKLLSDTQKMILTLSDMGKSENEVKAIMNLSDGAYRTARSRIRGRKKQ